MCCIRDAHSAPTTDVAVPTRTQVLQVRLHNWQLGARLKKGIKGPKDVIAVAWGASCLREAIQ